MIALEIFREHLDGCDYCRDHKDDLCSIGSHLEWRAWREINSPNTVRGIHEGRQIVCSCDECRPELHFGENS